MKIIQRSLFVGLIMGTIVLTGLSCSHDQSIKKDATTAGTEHERLLEKYQKGVTDSKTVIVARVNSVPISMYDLISRMNQIAPSYLAHGLQRNPEIDQVIKKDALDILIFRELAVQEAARQGMKVDAAKVDEELTAMKANLGSDEAYQTYLRNMAVSEDMVRGAIERNQLFDMITKQEIYRKIAPAGAEEHSIDDRKQEWEAELKKNASIEVLLEEAEKKLRENAGKQNAE